MTKPSLITSLGVAVLSLGFLVPSDAHAFALAEDFDSYTAGATTAATGGVWDGVFVGTGNSNIVASDGGMALETKGGAAWRGGKTDLTQWNAGIAIGETATIFFQMKAVGAGSYDIMTGLTASANNIDTNNAWQDFAVMPFVAGTAGDTLAYRMSNAGLTGDVIFSMDTDVWYNVWLVVDNAEENYSVYYSTGTSGGTLGGTATVYRNGFTNSALNALGFMAAGGNTTSLLVDNVYYAAGESIVNPIPEPSTYTLIFGALTLTAVIARRKSRKV